jgi:hypothetical protein
MAPNEVNHPMKLQVTQVWRGSDRQGTAVTERRAIAFSPAAEELLAGILDDILGGPDITTEIKACKVIEP